MRMHRSQTHRATLRDEQHTTCSRRPCASEPARERHLLDTRSPPHQSQSSRHYRTQPVGTHHHRCPPGLAPALEPGRFYNHPLRRPRPVRHYKVDRLDALVDACPPALGLLHEDFIQQRPRHPEAVLSLYRVAAASPRAGVCEQAPTRQLGRSMLSNCIQESHASQGGHSARVDALAARFGSRELGPIEYDYVQSVQRQKARQRASGHTCPDDDDIGVGRTVGHTGCPTRASR